MKPMTTTRAVLDNACHECKMGGDCGRDCVESHTCSFICPQCEERLWFYGDVSKAPKIIICFKCGCEKINMFRR